MGEDWPKGKNKGSKAWGKTWAKNKIRHGSVKGVEIVKEREWWGS